MTRKLDVLWVSHFAPYPPKGGAMQRSYNMLKECSSFSNIHFVSLMPRSKINAFYKDYSKGISEVSSALKEICTSVELVEHGRDSRKFNKLVKGLRTAISRSPYDAVALANREFKNLLSTLEKHEFDLVYVDTVGLLPQLPFSDLPFIINHHNIESEMLSRRSLNESLPLSLFFKWQSRKTRVLEQHFVSKAKVNFVCSDLDGSKLRDLSPCETLTVPNGVDLTYFKRRHPYDSSVCDGAIFAGGLDWYPNKSAVTFIVEEVHPLLIERQLNIELKICGKGEHSVLARAAKQNKLINAMGFVDDIRIQLEKARYYLCPITDGGGTKLKVLDALAMGVPLIANPIACEGIDVIDGEHVLYARTAEEFVSAIEKLDKDPCLASRLSKNGMALIESKYEYSAIGLKIEKAFRQAVNENS